MLVIARLKPANPAKKPDTTALNLLLGHLESRTFLPTNTITTQITIIPTEIKPGLIVKLSGINFANGTASILAASPPTNTPIINRWDFSSPKKKQPAVEAAKTAKNIISKPMFIE